MDGIPVRLGPSQKEASHARFNRCIALWCRSPELLCLFKPAGTGEYFHDARDQSTRHVPIIATAANKAIWLFYQGIYGPLEAISSEAYESRDRNARGSEDGSAEERVVGTLDGRQGSFVLEHTAANDLRVNGDFLIVAGSGSGQLRGITGHLMTDRHEKPYRYELIYSVPDPAQK